MEKTKEEIIDTLLVRMMLLDGNETTELTQEGQQYFKELIAELTKVKYDIRWCGNDKCSCHPESRIKQILLTKIDLGLFLAREGLFTRIKELIENYTPVTVYQKGYVE